jgi:hypothetical protein
MRLLLAHLRLDVLNVVVDNIIAALSDWSSPSTFAPASVGASQLPGFVCIPLHRERSNDTRARRSFREMRLT